MPASTANSATTLSRTRLDFIEAAGRLLQMLGLPRSTGQIYGLLHLSPRPLTLDDIAHLLSISKASASTGTRQLVSWHAVRQVWVQGDRRDHFESVSDLRQVIKNVYDSFFLPKLAKSQGRLESILATLETEHQTGTIPPDEYEFCAQRLRHIAGLQGRVTKLLPLAEKML